MKFNGYCHQQIYYVFWQSESNFFLTNTYIIWSVQRTLVNSWLQIVTTYNLDGSYTISLKFSVMLPDENLQL